MFSTQGVFYAGKYKGTRIRDAEANYLRWMYWHLDLGEPKDGQISDELKRRREPLTDRQNNQEARDQKRGEGSAPISRQFPAAVNLAVLMEIVAAGRQSLAKRHHPDVAGDAEMMKQINIAADAVGEWLTSQGVGK